MSDYTIETAPPIIDGMVHLTYYLCDAQLSFVWSGPPNRRSENGTVRSQMA